MAISQASAALHDLYPVGAEPFVQLSCDAQMHDHTVGAAFVLQQQQVDNEPHVIVAGHNGPLHVQLAPGGIPIAAATVIVPASAVAIIRREELMGLAPCEAAQPRAGTLPPPGRSQAEISDSPQVLRAPRTALADAML